MVGWCPGLAWLAIVAWQGLVMARPVRQCLPVGGGKAGKKCGGKVLPGCGVREPSPSQPHTTAKLVGEEKKIKFLFL